MGKEAMNTQAFNAGLLEFLQASPTPFHATKNIAQQLTEAGFVELREGDAWNLQPGGRYWLTRNDSSIIGFVFGQRPMLETGIRMVGAHTDSPCLKVKPQPELTRKRYAQLGVEVYGGVLMAPWIERDLSLAGRVSYRGEGERMGPARMDFAGRIAVLPGLAFLLAREAIRHAGTNPQKDLPRQLLHLARTA